MTDVQPPVKRSHHRPMLVRARLSAAQFHRLERAALRRRITPVELVTRIVRTVLDDNIITAVLDDNQGAPDVPST